MMINIFYLQKSIKRCPVENLLILLAAWLLEETMSFFHSPLVSPLGIVVWIIMFPFSGTSIKHGETKNLSLPPPLLLHSQVEPTIRHLIYSMPLKGLGRNLLWAESRNSVHSSFSYSGFFFKKKLMFFLT